MKKTLSIMIILVIALSVLVGCGPDRRQASDILLKYAKPAAGAIVVEWTNITTSEDPKLKDLSGDISSLGDELLVYIPIPDTMTLIGNPKPIWDGVLLIFHKPKAGKGKAFAERLAEVLKKWFDIQADVSQSGETTNITFMETTLGVYKDGDYIILSGGPLQRQSNHPPQLETLIGDMLKLGGDVRLGLFYKDISGVIYMKGESDTIGGYINPGISGSASIDKNLMPAWLAVNPKQAELVVVGSGYVVKAAYHIATTLSQGLLAEKNIPDDITFTAVAGKDGGMVSIGGITPQRLADLLKELTHSDIKLTPAGTVGEAEVYMLDGSTLLYIPPVIYGLTENLEPEQAAEKLITQEAAGNARALRDMIPGDSDLQLWLKARAPEPFGILQLTARGTDKLQITARLPKPINIRDEIYKLMANFKDLTVLRQKQRQLQEVRAGMDMLAGYIHMVLDEGQNPQSIQELISALPEFSKRALKSMGWFGKSMFDVLTSEKATLKNIGDGVVVCIEVPEDYREVAGGRYGVIRVSQSDSQTYFSDSCP